MKVIKVQKHLTVVLDNGDTLTNTDCDDVLYNAVLLNQDNEDKVRELVMPQLQEKIQEKEIITEMIDGFENSRYLSVFASSIYIKLVSELSVPQDLAVALYNAELKDNQELIDTYLNFWTLVSTNQDSRVRTNLFWFLNKYGMTISKSGLFVGYRNVLLKSEGSGISNELAKFVSSKYTKVKFKWKKSPKNYYVKYGKDKNLVCNNSRYDSIGRLDELYAKLSEEVAPVYTDAHTETMEIRIGVPVYKPREECDSDSDICCSRGLHSAGKEWLQQQGDSYYGNIPLKVLINPADVVAIPHADNYGKLRTCAYYPMEILSWEDGKLIENEITDGFEDDFFNYITDYNKETDTEEEAEYKLVIPEIPELNKTTIVNRLQEIKNKLSNKIV